MSSSPDPHEQQIVRSWHSNAEPWSEAIRTGSIASRRQATDQAIVEAVLHTKPERVLDVGCGEGWLARKLLDQNIAVVGIDAVAALVARATSGAQERGGQGDPQHGPHRAGVFHVLDYAGLANRELRCEPCDAAVCNFSLLGHDSVEQLLTAIPWYLHPRGHLVIQTLHPRSACGEAPYEDGWRAGNWGGFGPAFQDPAPWYFRTLESWLSMLRRCGFDLEEMREPALPGSRVPASVLFICKMLEVTT